MKKKIRRSVAHLEPTQSRRLHLARETVKVLTNDDLLRAVGGATECVTTSWSTESQLTTKK